MPRVNRFPKMAALQKFRAMKLGYPEDTAESIGIAEALKYAIFKRIAHSGKRYRELEEKKKKPEISLDWETFRTFGLASHRGKPFVGGKILTPEDYRKAVLYRWGETGRRIESWAKSIIDLVPEEYLRDERKFFKEVWVPHRDEPIE